MDVSALLISNIKNVSYLTGFTGSAGYLLITPNSQVLLSDSRYLAQLQDECAELDVDIRTAGSTMVDSVKRVAEDSKFNSLGFESTSLTKHEFDQLSSMTPKIDWVPSVGLVESARAIKDKIEIAAIRRSISLNQRAFEVIKHQLHPDQTERQIAHNLEHQMRSFGAQGCAFDPIVGVGDRSALPHGRPGNKKVGESPFLLIDWGAEVDRYMSDLTRVVFTGKVPAKFRKIYEIVLQAQSAAIKKIRPGVELKTVDSAARRVIESAGFGPNFGHGLGHGFGLEIHETPFISPIHEGKLFPGMVITIEPGIYLPNFGGVRIEDDILVTAEGCEVLSDLPREIEECTVDVGR
tara:strand:+ start:671 stop:1720 length:1050 start_codon:yes stop_codon:yes gene_type:complete